MRAIVAVFTLALSLTSAGATPCWNADDAAAALRLAKNPQVIKHFQNHRNLAAEVAGETCWYLGMFGSVTDTDYAKGLDNETDGIPIAILEDAQARDRTALQVYAAVQSQFGRPMRLVPLPLRRPSHASRPPP